MTKASAAKVRNMKAQDEGNNDRFDSFANGTSPRCVIRGSHFLGRGCGLDSFVHGSGPRLFKIQYKKTLVVADLAV